MYYINCFFVYSILGFFLETSFSFFKGFSYESGILYGPWTPVYGFGVIVIFFFAKKIKKWNIPKIFKFFFLFLSTSVVLSIMEVIGGYFIEWFFHTRFWDYSDMKFPITPYTSLEMSVLWGVLSLLLYSFIKPILDKIVKKIPNYLTCIFILLMFIDLLFTVIHHYQP